ncbi:MAG: M15 family metallopeptidase [Saprospiraceae bacterium]|jgi:LAS superfamily LD-carboxypeptidase LdcB
MKYTLTIVLALILFSSCKAYTDKKEVEQSFSVQDTLKADAPDYKIEYIMGQFDPALDSHFVLIPSQYRDEELRYIRKDVLNAFIKMYEAAAKDGIKLVIISATRNFYAQKRIWENKWLGKTLLEGNINAAKDIKDDVSRAKKILQYSSMPGTSRHHWGTDMDFNHLTNEWFEKGEGLKLYSWLQKNAASFGFCQPYTAMGSDRDSGYFEEKWHWTYIPISNEITKQAKVKINNTLIKGFLGCETATKLDILNNYILGISPKCTTKD